MSKKYKYNKLKWNFILLGFMIFITLFLSIGYAALESITLDIEGEVTALPQSKIFVTDVQYKTSLGADINSSAINQYYQTMMQSTVVLGNDGNSSITYDITIYNSEDKAYTFEKVEYAEEFYSNPNIVFELEGLNQGDIISGNEYFTFSITFSYLNNTISDSNILNSYLNFKFIKDKLDDTNIVTTQKKINIYNADMDKIQFEVTNNNEFEVSIDLKINDYIIDTMSLASEETVTINKDIKDGLALMQSNQEYTITIVQTEPYTITKQSSVKLEFIPTITNYNFGLKDAGTEQNPYILYRIEDVVRFAQNVNSGNTFSNMYLKMLNDLDFEKSIDYYNFKDTSFGDLNGNSSDANEILTEMTTGKGFIMIGETTQDKTFQGVFDGNNHTISNIYMDKTGETETTTYGFFRGIKDATIKNTTISGNYIIVNDGAGFAGAVSGTANIINCHNNVNVTNTSADQSIGGILGTLNAGSNVRVDNCSNNASVTNNGAAGGLVGFVISSTITVTNSYNAGTITSKKESSSFAAGLVVKDNSGGGTIIIKNSFNKGEIYGIENVGGLVSRSTGTLNIDSSYNIGKVIGTSKVGGILGDHSKSWGSAIGDVTITNTYNIGDISGTNYVGGIIGYNSEGIYEISKAYYLQNGTLLNVGNIANENTCLRTEEYMKSSEFVTLLGENFTSDTNNINNGYPILTNQK